MNYQKPDVEKVIKIRRYTSLRYLNAILFFICLYWMISLFVLRLTLQTLIPLFIMVLIIITVKDHYHSFTKKEVEIKRSKNIYGLIIIIYIIVGIITFSNYTLFFPYVANKDYALIMIGIMLILSVLLFVKANKIYKNTDRVYVKYMTKNKGK